MANEKVDVVIVGAGASGSVYANVLTKAGKKVVLFDNGPDWQLTDLISSDIWGRRIKPAGPPFILEGKHPVEATAFYIHARIHAGNPKATVVLHTHMPYVTALTSIRDGRIEMCSQNALRYWDRIAYDEAYGGVALSNDEGERMCRAMGGKEILFLRNHGVIVSGPSRL